MRGLLALLRRGGETALGYFRSHAHGADEDRWAWDKLETMRDAMVFFRGAAKIGMSRKSMQAGLHGEETGP